MPTYKLTLEYDGTRYRGWQTQKNTDRTVAAAVERAARELFGEEIRIHGAGRTDAGVHALAQVAHFKVRKRYSGEEILYGLNDRLPFDVNVLESSTVHDTFHARHDAVSRTYLYRISRRRTAFEKRYVWWVRDSLSLEAMRSCAKLLPGRHDFASFCENAQGQSSTLVEVESCEVLEEADKILIRVTASHFLWKMVRRIVGTLVEVGRGTTTEAHVRKLLGSKSAEPAKWTAPPSGLFLESVKYAPVRRD
jgi:tRNA pseudouridine38-40 synthase